VRVVALADHLGDAGRSRPDPYNILERQFGASGSTAGAVSDQRAANGTFAGRTRVRSPCPRGVEGVRLRV
jgi:hypothetical protein